MADEFRTIETKTESSGVSTMAFVLGGVVVAVGVIGWLVFGGNFKTASVGSGDTTSITVQTPAPAEPAPAVTAPATPAPAKPAP